MARFVPAFVVALAIASLRCGDGTTPPPGASQSAAMRPARPEPAAPLEPEAERTLYRIRATLDPVGHSLEGEEHITWTNTSSSVVRDLYLYLHLNAFRHEETLFARGARRGLRGLSWRGAGSIELRSVRLDGVEPVEREESETWVRVRPPEAVPPGGTVELTAAFEVRLPPVFARTGWDGTFHLVAQWYPKLPVLADDGTWELRERHAHAEFHADHADYDVTLAAPPGWTVGAVGREVAPETPASGPGEVRHRFVIRRAVDFAWTAWDRFVELREELDGVEVRWLYPAGADRSLGRQRLALAAALRLLRGWLGDPPYPFLTVVLPPAGAEGAGGMEYPSLITTASSSELPGYRDEQEVVIHELGHQWFYATVATDEAREPWLDEALTTWITGAALDAIFGADRSIASAGPVGIGYFASRRACWRLVDPRLPVVLAADEYPSFDRYAAAVYCRGALALEALAAAVGRDRLLRGLARYVATRRFARATADDLYAALETECGEAVDRVLRVALRARRGFDLRLEEVEVRRVEDDAELLAPRTGPGDRWVTSFVVARHGAPVELPLEVEVRFPGAARRGRWDGRGRSARFAVQSDRPPEAIVLDPDHRALLDENLLDNGWRARDPDPADGLLDELLAGFGGLLGALF
ncbi:MAG: M1 family metallopeptidase [Deltaproteobacteria bacterium]|nr:M1 family metallopeptidase [Deltaproteobacteria bacterium]